MERKIKWKYEIGEIIKDDKRDLTIIDKKNMVKNNRTRKYYKYKCNKCGFKCGEHYKNREYNEEHWIEESSLYNKKGCSACCKPIKLIVKGINDIATTDPELVKYFVNIKDACTHSKSSGEKVLCKCPDCGFEKEMVMDKLFNNGFSCPNCSDNFKYPEKLMFNLLKQLNRNKVINNYVYQYTKTHAKWVDNYRYDFYFELDNEGYIIETNGLQHYEKGFHKSLEDIQENDKIKKKLAIHNGIKDENYIVIDCRCSNLEFIKENILNSKLNEVFNLADINWNIIGQKSEASLVKEVAKYWHLHNEINCEGLKTKDLSKIFKISITTIRKYLNRGFTLNWCNYNGKKELKEHCNKPVGVFKNGKTLGTFISTMDLERQSENLLGVKLFNTHISRVCLGKQEKYKGFTFKYV